MSVIMGNQINNCIRKKMVLYHFVGPSISSLASDQLPALFSLDHLCSLKSEM